MIYVIKKGHDHECQGQLAKAPRQEEGPWYPPSPSPYSLAPLDVGERGE